MHSGEVWDKEMSRVLGGTEWDSVRFRYGTQSGAQFKTYELFTYGIFHLISSDRGGSLRTETTGRGTVDKGEPCAVRGRESEDRLPTDDSVRGY